MTTIQIHGYFELKKGDSVAYNETLAHKVYIEILDNNKDILKSIIKAGNNKPMIRYSKINRRNKEGDRFLYFSGVFELLTNKQINKSVIKNLANVNVYLT